MLQAFSIAVGVAVSALTLGLLVNHKRDKAFYKFMPYMVSVGAGMLLAISFTEFIPHAIESGSRWSSLFIFSGVLSVILAEKYISPILSGFSSHSCDHHHDQNLDSSPSVISRQAACSSIGCILVCAFFDGMGIPVAFQLSQETGFIVGSSLFLHTIPEGALAASIAFAGGLTQKESKIGIYLVALAILLGAILSTSLSLVFAFEVFVLPFVAGVLIYVAIGHLIPAVLKTKFGLYGVVAGAVFIFLLTQGHTH